MRSDGGKFYWKRGENLNSSSSSSNGIIVIFGWISITEAELEGLINLYASLGWNSLVSRSDFLNPFIPERATSLAFSLLDELIKELRRGICPVVIAAFSGGSKACMYKFFQIIEGCSEVELSLEDSTLVASCISGQIYDSDPIEFTTDLGARFALNQSILKVPGSSKLISLFAKGVTSSLDALFITRFGSQRAEYWQALYSSVGLGAPFLILCSESDDMAPFSTLHKFVKHLRDVGGNVKLVKWSTSAQVGHEKHQLEHYRAAITELLEQAVSIFSEKIQKLRERSHDEVSGLIWDLQKAAVDSSESFKRVAVGPNDHFFLPSSSDYKDNSREFGSLQEERKERLPQRSSPCMNANSVLGKIFFEVCVPKNVEDWCLNVEPVRRKFPFSGIKHRRSRL